MFRRYFCRRRRRRRIVVLSFNFWGWEEERSDKIGLQIDRALSVCVASRL